MTNIEKKRQQARNYYDRNKIKILQKTNKQKNNKDIPDGYDTVENYCKENNLTGAQCVELSRRGMVNMKRINNEWYVKKCS